MSNGTNTPQGLQIVESAIGNGGTQKLKSYLIYSSADGTVTQPNSIFSGDAVKWVSNPGVVAMAGTIAPVFSTVGLPNPAVGIPNVATTAADAFLGVFVYCTYMSAQTKLLVQANYWPGGNMVMPSTPIIAYVNDDPMAIFRIQVSTSIANSLVTSTFLNSQCGLNANLAVSGIPFTAPIPIPAQNPATGNIRNGISAYYLDGNSIAVDADLDLKIIGIAPDVNQNTNRNLLIPGVNMPFVNLLVKFNKHVYGSSGVAGRTNGI